MAQKVYLDFFGHSLERKNGPLPLSIICGVLHIFSWFKSVLEAGTSF